MSKVRITKRGNVKLTLTMEEARVIRDLYGWSNTEWLSEATQGALEESRIELLDELWVELTKTI